MKKILLFLMIIISTSYLIAQINSAENKQFTIAEVGWTFTVPEGFIFEDSSTQKLNPTPAIEYWMKQLKFKNDKNSLQF